MQITDKRLSIHHIGGRSGSREFPVLKKFERDIVNVLYDADADCLAQIRERNKSYESELHVLPYCLGDSCKSGYVNINYDPYTSSLYSMNPCYNLYYSFYNGHDYLLSEALKTMERRSLEIVTLDHIFHSQQSCVPAPDFLSVDTQGAEYDILSGAGETLKSNIVAVCVEAEFHALYKEQKLFGDLVKLLSGRGFDFVKFLHTGQMSPFRSPVGLRGEGFQTTCDALFFKRLDYINNNEEGFKRYFMLRKLAFISIIFDQFEYGMECLRRSRTFEPGQAETGAQPLYLRFLSELEQAAERMPAVYPPTFAVKYPSFELSKSRFKSAKKDTSTEGVAARGLALKQLLKKLPGLYLFLRALKWRLPGMLSQGALRMKKKLAPKSEVEAILLQYGLKEQASLLRKNRVVQTQSLKKS